MNEKTIAVDYGRPRMKIIEQVDHWHEADDGRLVVCRRDKVSGRPDKIAEFFHYKAVYLINTDEAFPG